MSAAEKLLYSPDHYLELERAAQTRHALIHGEMIGMAGASEPHVLIAGNILTELNIQLRGRQCRVYGSDMKVAVAETGLYTYPDVVAVCGEPLFRDGSRDVLLNPSLIVEVLSPSTEAFDRGAKFAHYRRLPSLREYVLIAQEEMRVEVYMAVDDGTWSLREYSDPNAEVPLTSVNVRLQLAEAYRLVEFPSAGEQT